MRQFLPLFLFLLSVSLFAQQRAEEYVDVVYFVGGGSYEGTILEYKHGDKVIFVNERGDLKEFDWVDIKRVNFRLDKDRLKDISQRESAKPENTLTPFGDMGLKDAFVPSRKTRHQLTGSVSLGRNNGRFGPATTIGGTFAYHLIRKVSFVNVGLGLDLSLMSQTRKENVGAGTVQIEVPIGKKKVRPFFRFETGPTYPFGSLNTEDEVSDRKITVLYHPSIGLELAPPADGWGSLVFDLGYRFLDSRFTVTTFTLDVVERNIQYRRLMLRGGIRF